MRTFMECTAIAALFIALVVGPAVIVEVWRA